MGNCLITRLKGVVDNPNLLIYGNLSVKVSHYDGTLIDTPYIYLRANDKTITVKTVGGAYMSTVKGEEITSPVDTVVVPANTSTQIYFANSNYYVNIGGKYDDATLIYGFFGNIFETTIPDVTYAPNIQEIYLNSTLATGNISHLANLSQLNSFQCIDSRVTGDIGVIGNISSILYCYFNNSSVYGTIEDMVSNFVTNGRQESTLQLGFSQYDNITFGGQHLNCSGMTWNGVSKVYCYNSTSIADSSVIYAKGATSSEIAAWEQAGKTVVVVS